MNASWFVISGYIEVNSRLQESSVSAIFLQT